MSCLSASLRSERKESGPPRVDGMPTDPLSCPGHQWFAAVVAGQMVQCQYSTDDTSFV
jgi:hypothetical protein